MPQASGPHDGLCTQLNSRFSGLHEVSTFSALQPTSLQNPELELHTKATKYVSKYHKDVAQSSTQEILSMRSALMGEIVSTIRELVISWSLRTTLNQRFPRDLHDLGIAFGNFSDNWKCRALFMNRNYYYLFFIYLFFSV